MSILFTYFCIDMTESFSYSAFICMNIFLVNFHYYLGLRELRETDAKIREPSAGPSLAAAQVSVATEHPESEDVSAGAPAE